MVLQTLGLQSLFLHSMLSKEEEDFMIYWEKNREKKKKVWRNLSVGLPLGVMIVVSIFANVISGWYKRATMEANTDSSFIIILIIASLLIVCFISIFTARHKWDMYEQRYKELKHIRDNNL